MDGRCKKKIPLRKKRLESKLRKKYILNLLSEPQHSAKIKMSTSVFQCQGYLKVKNEKYFVQ